MHEQGGMERAKKHWTLSWVVLALAFAFHVADEAANDFLAFWNPLVHSLRDRVPALPLPTFSLELWLGGLIGAVLLLLSLSWFVWHGAAWMRPVSYVLAVIMLGNGLIHLAGTAYSGQAIPGVYSSPVLLLAAGLLLVTARRHGMASGRARRAV